MEIPTLKAEPRRAAGSRAAGRLRRAGKLPAIVYGHQQDPVAITLDYHDIALHVSHGTHVVNLDINGQVQACLFKDTQYDHLGAKLIHLDLTRVDLSERVRVQVRLELRGQAKGVAEGGILNQALTDIEVECPVREIPEVIRVDISHLDLNQVLYVKDLILPAGVTTIEDAEIVVATVRLPAAVVEAAPVEAEAAAAAAEPEVIAKGKVETEEAEKAE